MYLFFDTETTGVYDFKSPPSADHQPHICQLGAILTDVDGSTRGEINFLIKPAGWTIPPEAEAVHHISQTDCESFGIDIRDALAMFKRLAGHAGLMVAHNINFDIGMLQRELHALGIEETFLDEPDRACTMELTTPVLKLPGKYGDYKWPQLAEAYRHYFGEDFEGAHDAMADIRACRDVFFAYQRASHEAKHAA